MRWPRPLPLLFALTLFALAAGATVGASADLKPGARLASFTVGSRTYLEVEIRTITARTVTFRHRGGLASVHLKDLPPEWQARFHYDPAADAAAEQALQTATRERAQAALAPPAISKTETLLRRFGQPPEIHSEVDLRPRFAALELGVKKQGRRPSCAIFAVVSALEFQSAELTGRPQNFSEEYLTWATRQTTRRIQVEPPAGEDASAATGAEDADAGFALGEVITALRAYGIPPQSAMPNTLGRAMNAIAAPAAAVVAEARTHQRVFVHGVPGRDNGTRLANLIHVLNQGVPVVAGLPWPGYRSLRGGYLNSQQPRPGLGHAVTIVGYRNAGGDIGETEFIFKNSWGVEWGQGGYGLVTYRYLLAHLGDAIVLEVQLPTGDRQG